MSTSFKYREGERERKSNWMLIQSFVLVFAIYLCVYKIYIAAWNHMRFKDIGKFCHLDKVDWFCFSLFSFLLPYFHSVPFQFLNWEVIHIPSHECNGKRTPNRIIYTHNNTHNPLHGYCIYLSVRSYAVDSEAAKIEPKTISTRRIKSTRLRKFYTLMRDMHHTNTSAAYAVSFFYWFAFIGSVCACVRAFFSLKAQKRTTTAATVNAIKYV